MENTQTNSNLNLKSTYTPVRVGDLYKASCNRQEDGERTGKQEITGISSGFKSLDGLTGGWQNSELIILAGRPSMGKSALALNMMSNIAVNQGIPAAFFSLDSSGKHILSRLEKEEQRGDYNPLINAPLYIDDSPSLSVAELREKTQILVREHGVKIIMIDYIQLMNASGMMYDSRLEEMSIIIRSLKALAKELNIPIIAISQLNQSVGRYSNSPEFSESKRPQLCGLREYGSIVEDADMICFIHRPEYYKIMKDQYGNDTKGVAEIIIAKNRNGRRGTAYLGFIDELVKFADLPMERLEQLTHKGADIRS